MAGPVLRDTDPLYGPYVGVLAGHLAMLALTWRESGPDAVHWANRMRAAALGVLCVVPWGIAVWTRGPRPEATISAVSVALLAFGVYTALRWAPRVPRGATWELRLQMLSTLAALALVLPVLLWALTGR